MSYESTKSSIMKDAKAIKDEASDRAADAFDEIQKEAAAVRQVVQKSAADIAAEVTKKLKEAGVDTDQLIIKAKEQAGDIQKLIVNEVRERPFRAIGMAALAGVVFGLMSSR